MKRKPNNPKMKRRSNNPNSNSTRTIVRTYLIVIGIDLVILAIAMLTEAILSSMDPSPDLYIAIMFSLIFLIIVAGKFLIVLLVAITLLILGKWEVAAGLLWADITLLLLLFGCCLISL